MTLSRNYNDIIRLGFPILVGQLGMIFVGFADTNMVGRYSTEALAAASFVNNVFNIVILGCLGFTYGLTPLIGALFSRKESSRIGATLRDGLAINLIFALSVTALMTLLYFHVDKLGQPAELLPILRPYFVTYLAGIVPISVFNVFAQWSYAINRTRMPMWIILTANVTNVLFNWLLIYGNCGFPELGLTGAGLATLLARWLCAAAIIAVFICHRDFKDYRMGFRRARLSLRGMGQVGRVSWPVALQMSMETGAFSGAAVMAGWLGALELASFQLMVTIGTLGFCIYYSMAAAVSVLVANAAGRGDVAGMRSVAFAGYRIILVLATCSSLVFVLLGRDLIGFFTEDPEVISMATGLIFPLVLYQYADATQISFANALRGTSRVTVMSWIAFVSYVVIGLPSTYLMAFTAGMGIYGIILSFSVSLFAAAALFLGFFLRYTPLMNKR